MTKIIWTAEIGSSHKGSPALAYEMIRRFSEAGATICKFQFGWTKEAQEAMGHEYNPVRYVDPWADDLANWCDYFGVELMASIWSMEGLDTARSINMKRYKIAHQLWEMNNEFACEIIADVKETFISGALPDQVANWEFAHSIYCSTFYPTYPNELVIPACFNNTVWRYGYSDHSHGIAPCLLAVARGALYIEKHVCLDKTDLTVKDTPFSADPDEFAEMVRLGSEMRRLLDAGV